MVSLSYIFLQENIIWWILHTQMRLDTWLLIQERLFGTTFQNSKAAANAAMGHKVVKKTLTIIIPLCVE